MHQLTSEEQYIILDKGTEAPFSGEYHDFYNNGLYVCRQCGAALYRSMDKFHSGCGWPSFDDEIARAVEKLPDADGRRTEILCRQCGGHLGHVFHGEQYTEKDTRHCVNSLSMRFLSFEKLLAHEQYGQLIVAGGCFWGIEYFYEQETGVLATACGYVGGTLDHPTYQQVCRGDTGHAEAVAVIFDKTQTDEKRLLALFFDIHNPVEINRQGPDIGSQYRSAIFPVHAQQQAIAQAYLEKIAKDYAKPIATKIESFDRFWMAEDAHQKYFSSRKLAPTCHVRSSDRE